MFQLAPRQFMRRVNNRLFRALAPQNINSNGTLLLNRASYLPVSHRPRKFSTASAFMASSGSAHTEKRTTSLREREALKLLCKVTHPEKKEDIILSGMVTSLTEKDGVVSVSIQLDKHFRTLKREIEQTLKTNLLHVDAEPSPARWLRSVRVSIAPTENDPASLDVMKRPQQHRQGHVAKAGAVGPRGLSDVKAVIAVSSGKGGVGKSSVAVNLAYALSQLYNSEDQPLKIGILDTDIHGPSLPTMVSPKDLSLKEYITEDGDSLIEPLSYEGVKLMSYGYVPQNRVIDGNSATDGKGGSASAIMRGPMAAQLVNELATRTHWGDLDYLIIDMPPGTGDIALTLTQNIRITASVIVTTPQKLAYVDVVRGVDLFDITRVPVLAVVQNMSYFIAPTDPTNTKHFIFGDGSKYVNKLQTEWGIKHVFNLPLVPSIAAHGDGGDPFVLGDRYSSLTVDATRNTVAGENTTTQSATDYSYLASECRKEYESLAKLVQDTCGTSEARALLQHNTWDAVYNAENNTIDIIQVMNNDSNNTVADTASTRTNDIENTATKNGKNTGKLSLSSVKPISTFTSDTAPTATGSAAVDAITSTPPPTYRIPSRELRLACKCAACIHEFTGQPLLKPERVPVSVKPRSIVSRGQYAVSITWTDGHSSSMYSWKQLEELGQKFI